MIGLAKDSQEVRSGSVDYGVAQSLSTFVRNCIYMLSVMLAAMLSYYIDVLNCVDISFTCMKTSFQFPYFKEVLSSGDVLEGEAEGASFTVEVVYVQDGEGVSILVLHLHCLEVHTGF